MNATVMEQPFPEGTPFPSPVQKILATDYYDGPTYGLLSCAGAGTYRFEIVAWDQETLNLRVFSLAPMPPAAIDRLVLLFAKHQKPCWPVWVLGWHEDLNEATDATLAEARLVEWVIATEDLLGIILAAKRVGPDDLQEVADWRAFLGLGADAPCLVNRLP